MRTRAEIHKRARELRDAATEGCDCRECEILLVCSQALEWALGDANDKPEVAARLAAAAAKNRAAQRRHK